MKNIYVFLLLCLSGVMIECQSLNYCPPDGLLHFTNTNDQICYYGYNGYGDYTQSEHYCLSNGGYLAEIPDEAAQIAVFHYIQAKGLNGWGVWLGYKTDSSNNMLNKDNIIQTNYNNFIAGEPSSYVTECVHICDANTGEWCASNCNTPHQALCSIHYNAVPPEVTTEPTTVQTTPDETTIEPTTQSTEAITTATANHCTIQGGFVHAAYCYWILPNYYTFGEADFACTQNGGSLAEMSNLSGLTSIYQLLTDRGYNTESIWIGYLVFIDGFSNVHRYTLDCHLQTWPYYVSNFNVIDDCVSLQTNSNGMMSSDFCTTEKKALCFNKTLNMATCNNPFPEIVDSETTSNAASTDETLSSTSSTTTAAETTTTTVTAATTTSATSITAATTTSAPSTTATTQSTLTTVTLASTTSLTTATTTSAPPPPTTTQSTSISELGQNAGTTAPTDVCVCQCEGNEKSTINVTAHDLAKALSVNKSTLSSVRRSKTSADDPRPSARYLGSVGIAMLSVVFGSLIVMDAFRICA